MQANEQQLSERIENLARIGGAEGGGMMRLAFSDEDIAGREYIMELMNNLQLDVKIDAAGNIIGRRAGSESGLPVIAFGSHVDTVPYGGKYDGNLGVLAALETIQLFNDQGISTRHPLEVVVFAAEEEGLYGSRAMAMGLADDELATVVNCGKTVRDGIAAIGGNPDQIGEAKRNRDEFCAYLELHIEQGKVLETQANTIGVVEGIVALHQYTIKLTGVANHAGTTPMHMRKDTLLAASRVIQQVHTLAFANKDKLVATVGQVQVFPGATNCIAGEVTLSLDCRSLDDKEIEKLVKQLKDFMNRQDKETGIRSTIKPVVFTAAAPASEFIQQTLAEQAEQLGYSYQHLPSGAGHDAQNMALVTAMGMLFVPSRDGVSHSPQEYTTPGHMAAGASVLASTVLKLDEKL
jgi:beta-ureidopropionase / N-carbamoyl-L-amino-acid hydrolase